MARTILTSILCRTKKKKTKLLNTCQVPATTRRLNTVEGNSKILLPLNLNNSIHSKCIAHISFQIFIFILARDYRCIITSTRTTLNRYLYSK